MASLPSPDDLEPEEISYGVCQGLRVLRVGMIYMIQQLKPGTDTWTTLAKADSGPDGMDDARHDAIVALNNMNREVTAMIRQNVERMR
jgi:hypothetical protein